MLFNIPNWEVQSAKPGQISKSWDTIIKTFSRAEAERHFDSQEGETRLLSLWDNQVIKEK